MNEKVQKVLLGYMELAEKEKLEFKKAIEEYERKSLNEQTRQYSDLREKRITSPVSSTSCPCCGK